MLTKNKRRTSQVFDSLNARHVYFGAERMYFAFTLIALMIGLSILRTMWAIPFGVVVHAIAVMLTRVDVDLLRVYVSYRHQVTHYKDLSSAFAIANLRPEGYGRHLLY